MCQDGHNNLQANRHRARLREVRLKSRNMSWALCLISYDCPGGERVNEVPCGERARKSRARTFGILVVAALPALVGGVREAQRPARETKSALVLSLRSAAQAQRCSNALLEAEVFTGPHSVRSYLEENSYGRASITGAVSGPHNITVGSACDFLRWGSQADAAAVAAGVNLGAYDLKVYVLPSETSSFCPGAAGYMDGDQIWIRGDACDSKFVYAHEFGHSYDVWHAGTPGAEYGDLSSVMGGIFDGLVDQPTYRAMFNATPHFTAPQKLSRGWLPASNVQTVTVGGNYRVALLENARTDIQALKIVVGTRHFYCSYRRAVGFDSSLLPQYVDKTSVHISDDRGASALYATLGDGESYSMLNVTVTQTSHDATHAYLTVSFATTTAAADDRTQVPHPKIREMATIPGAAVDEAVRLPNGRVVLYTVGDTIMAYDPTAKRGTLVTRGFDEELAISRTGDRIAYVAHESEDVTMNGIWVMPINRRTGFAVGRAQRISTSAGNSPIFSPDGKLVAFSAERTRETWDLVVVPTAGGTERTIARYDKYFMPVSWSADGKGVFVQMGRRGDPSVSIERVSAAGGRRESLMSYSPPSPFANITGQIGGYIAFYRPDIAAWAEGRLAYVTASGKRGEVRIPPTSGGFARSKQTVFTRTGGDGTSTIYELDLSPILRATETRQRIP